MFSRIVLPDLKKICFYKKIFNQKLHLKNPFKVDS